MWEGRRWERKREKREEKVEEEEEGVGERRERREEGEKEKRGGKEVGREEGGENGGGGEREGKRWERREGLLGRLGGGRVPCWEAGAVPLSGCWDTACRRGQRPCAQHRDLEAWDWGHFWQGPKMWGVDAPANFSL